MATTTRQPSRPQFSNEELTEVVREAARRQGDARRAEPQTDMVSVEDVYEVARELDISPEHVQSVIADLEARKRATATRGRRVRRFVYAMLIAAVAALGAWALADLGGMLVIMMIVAIPLLVLAALAFGPGKASDLRDRQIVPGRCRVCGRPAHTPESTFCEEHRYRPKGENAAGSI